MYRDFSHFGKHTNIYKQTKKARVDEGWTINILVTKVVYHCSIHLFITPIVLISRTSAGISYHFVRFDRSKCVKDHLSLFDTIMSYIYNFNGIYYCITTFIKQNQISINYTWCG